MARKASRVYRFHTEHVNREQGVGEHSYNVCCLLIAITNGDCSAALLKAALFHDMSECFYGDMPGNMKAQVPALRAAMKEADGQFEELYELKQSLTDDEYRLLKICDNLELLMKCTEELMMGNQFVLTMGETVASFLKEREYPKHEPWWTMAVHLVDHGLAEFNKQKRRFR